jgi:hypothetical protein
VFISCGTPLLSKRVLPRVHGFLQFPNLAENFFHGGGVNNPYSIPDFYAIDIMNAPVNIINAEVKRMDLCFSLSMCPPRRTAKTMLICLKPTT